MKMRFIWAALIVGLAGCVSDDQPNAIGTSSTDTKISTSTTLPAAESTEETSDSAQPSSSVSDKSTTTTSPGGDQDDSDTTDTTNVLDKPSESTERVQGKPITVTTVGAEVQGKSGDSSNVTISDNWCEASESGSLLALAEIVNSGGLEGDFIIEFAVLNALGVRVGEGVDVVHAVEPGQTFVAREIISDVVGWEGDPRSWSCQVLRISTPDATLSDN